MQSQIPVEEEEGILSRSQLSLDLYEHYPGGDFHDPTWSGPQYIKSARVHSNHITRIIRSY